MARMAVLQCCIFLRTLPTTVSNNNNNSHHLPLHIMLHCNSNYKCNSFKINNNNNKCSKQEVEAVECHLKVCFKYSKMSIRKR